MFCFLVQCTLRVLRCAGEVFFFFELNRFLGHIVSGSLRHRIKQLSAAEAQLLHNVRAPLHTTYIVLPSGVRIYTIIAGPPAHDANAGYPVCSPSTGAKAEPVWVPTWRSPQGSTSVLPSCSTAHEMPIDPGPNPIVLLHGHSMGGATFFRNIDDFLDMGFSSVYIPDLPGWGRSTRSRFSTCDVDSAVDFFLVPITQWLHSLRLSKFTVVGHSLGAYVAHEFALRAPVYMVKHLILIAPAAVCRRTPLSLSIWFAITPQRLLTQGGLLIHILFSSKYPSTPAYNIVGFREYTLYSNSISHCSGDKAASAVLRFFRRGLWKWDSECVRPLIERVKRLSCPVHLIAGKEDRLVNLDTMNALYNAMARVGNQVALGMIGNADHSPHITTPSAFAKVFARTLISSC